MQLNWQEVKRLLVVFVNSPQTGNLVPQEQSLPPQATKPLSGRQSAQADLVCVAAGFSLLGTGARSELIQNDITSLQPALQRIRETLAHTEIALLTSIRDTRPLLAWVNHTIPYTTAWQDVAKEKELVEKLRQLLFDAAIIFTDKVESPYPLAYLCYLAGIPIRVGQSREFGGSVLSHWIKPPLDDLPNIDPHLYLLDAAGFPIAQPLVPITKP